jgi:urease accessory protein
MADTPLHIDSRAGADAVPSHRLTLAFDMRSRSRFRATLDSGEAVDVLLPRGSTLRGGDKLRASDGRIVEVASAAEDLLEVRCTGRDLARIAYHLGNRHVAVEIGEQRVRFAEDHVLAAMVRGMGYEPMRVCVPFEPEAGAYAHEHASTGASARIHDFSRPPAHPR